MIVDRDTFEEWIRQAVESIPEKIRQKIWNVAFVLEDRPRRAYQGEYPIFAGRGMLLGLYHGVPLPSRSRNYTFVPPDTITLFQEAIEVYAGPDPKNIRQQVRHTIWHEVAHYLGMNETEVRSWESRRRGKKTGPARS